MIDDNRATMKLKVPNETNLKNSIGISSATQIDRSIDSNKIRAQKPRRCTVSSTGNRDLNIDINPALFVSRINKRDVTDDFEVGKILGQGAYGQVLLVKHKKTKLMRAMKTLKKKMVREGEIDLLQEEVNLLMSMDHPNIVKVYNLYEDERYFRIITE